MRFIESDVMIYPEVFDPLIRIEKVGRLCYKSGSDFTKGTAIKFFRQLVDSKHFAMLEHATFVFEVTQPVYLSCCVGKPYINATCVDTPSGKKRFLVSGNLRAIKENDLKPLMYELIQYYNYPELNYYFGISNIPTRHHGVELLSPKVTLHYLNLSPIEKQNHLYTTFRFICDRGVSHEMVRHRPASFAQESTRYCNYSKDKFGNEITCVKPAFYDSWSDEAKTVYENSLKLAEQNYFMLLDKGLTPQQARGVLPTDLKTEIFMTANLKEWSHFFDLRFKGTTGSPHPNMHKVASKAYSLYSEIM